MGGSLLQLPPIGWLDSGFLLVERPSQIAPFLQRPSNLRGGNGKSTLLWKDHWNGNLLASQYPELLLFFKIDRSSISFAKQAVDFSSLFHLPLSTQAFLQFQLVQGLLYDLILTSEEDSWLYIWNSGHYSSVKAYKQLMGTCSVPPSFKWLWACACQSRHKVFFWLLLRDRLNSRNILRRKGCQLEDYSCVLCDQGAEETIQHLFWTCPFAQECWSFICPQHSQLESTYQAILHLRNLLNDNLFMEIIVLASWAIWIARNNFIFNHLHPSLDSWRSTFSHEFALVIHRAKPKFKALFELWLSSLSLS